LNGDNPAKFKDEGALASKFDEPVGANQLILLVWRF